MYEEVDNAATAERKPYDPLAGSLFLLESAMLDRSRDGSTRPSLEAANAVAAAYWRSGRYFDALDLLEHTLIDCRAVLGLRDPDTLVVEGNLAVTYVCLDQFQRGLDLLVANVEARAAVVGDSHPHTLVARNALATAYHTADLLPEAMALFAGVARSGPARSPGPPRCAGLPDRPRAHADRLGRRCGCGLGAVLRAAGCGAVRGAARRDDGDDPQQPRAGTRFLGRADLAHAELERAAADCQTLLGANHPDTVALRTDLALLAREVLGVGSRSSCRPRDGGPAPQAKTLALEAGPPWPGAGVEGTTPGRARSRARGPVDMATLPAGSK